MSILDIKVGQFINIKTNEVKDSLSTTKVEANGSVIQGAMLRHWAVDGWRLVVEVEQPLEGMKVLERKCEEIPDSFTCRMIISSAVSIAEEIAEQARQEAQRKKEAEQQATLDRLNKINNMDASLKIQALMFRTIVRKHFGIKAETNKAITYTAVFTYFANKQANKTITTQDIADMYILEKLYLSILSWTNDGTTWSFPWEIIP